MALVCWSLCPYHYSRSVPLVVRIVFLCVVRFGYCCWRLACGLFFLCLGASGVCFSDLCLGLLVFLFWLFFGLCLHCLLFVFFFVGGSSGSSSCCVDSVGDVCGLSTMRSEASLVGSSFISSRNSSSMLLPVRSGFA